MYLCTKLGNTAYCVEGDVEASGYLDMMYLHKRLYVIKSLVNVDSKGYPYEGKRCDVSNLSCIQRADERR